MSDLRIVADSGAEPDAAEVDAEAQEPDAGIDEDASSPMDAASQPDGASADGQLPMLDAGPGGADADAADLDSDAQTEAGCAAPLMYYRDGDGDGYGDSASVTSACSAPAGYVTNGDDCDDGEDSVHPNAMDACNGVDDDCLQATSDGVHTCNGFRCTASACLTSCGGDGDCVAPLACQGGQCVANLAPGASCVADRFCQSGFCECADATCSTKRCASQRCATCRAVASGGTSCPDVLADGQEDRTCSGEKSCHAGSCKGDVGAGCAADAECASGSCDPSARCQLPSQTNGVCNSAPDCVTGHSCLNGACKKSSDVSCSADGECATGSCSASGLCKAPVGQDGSCNSAPDCVANFTCRNNQCKKNDGVACVADTECSSGACFGSCRGTPGGTDATCDTDPDCAATYACAGGFCKLRNGQACGWDIECHSKACSPIYRTCITQGVWGAPCNNTTLLCTGVNACYSGVCKVHLGMECATDGECGSGYCDQTVFPPECN